MTLQLSTETERLAVVRRYDVLDTPPDGAFERITSLAARLFDVPIAIVSIVDSNRIWFKSHHGLDIDQIDREPGLCASAIMHDGPWLVTDAAADARTLANPLVAGDFGLRFYAGVPLTTHDGYNLGTLCVIDKEPREVTEDEVRTLADLASVVMDELELRISAARTVALEAELRNVAQDVATTLQQSLLPPQLPTIDGLEFASRYFAANRSLVGGDFFDVVRLPTGCAVLLGDVCGKGPHAAALTAAARWTLRSASLNGWAPSTLLSRLNEVILRANEHPKRYLTIAYADVRPTSDGAEVTLALGGHPLPLVLRADGKVEAVGVTSPIVGWAPDAVFRDVAFELAAGDTILFYTDGLLDALGGRGTSEDTALRSVLGPLAGRTCEQIAQAIEEALNLDGLDDDAALLVARVR